jgi:8-oxo-dGTP diphosphatase
MSSMEQLHTNGETDGAQRREYPAMPLAAAGAIVVHEGRLLLVKRGQPPSQGLWSFPGGRIELGETVAQAATRETLEETGVVIRPRDVACVVDAVTRDEAGRVRYHYVIVDVYADYVRGEPVAATDSAQARWVSPEELASLDLTPTAVPMARRALGLEG